MSRFGRIVATGLGTGYLPVAPGTWGSGAVAGLFLLVAGLTGWCPYAAAVVMAVVAVLAAVACVAVAGGAETYFGRKDPSQVTADEWAGQAVALIALPVAGGGLAGWAAVAVTAAVGFVAFRFFDIVKPPPVCTAERLRGGWGILADDLLAGVYANAAAQLTLRLVVGMG